MLGANANGNTCANPGSDPSTDTDTDVQTEDLYLRPPVTRRVLLTSLCAVVLLLSAELLEAVLEPNSVRSRFLFGYGADTGFVRIGAQRIALQRTPGREIWDQEYPLHKAPGLQRIIVIGDSVARGGSYQSSFAGQLGDLLRAQGRTIEVWSLCAPGYGSRRKHLLLEQALRYAPDLLIYHLNISTEYEDEREWQRYQSLASWHPRNWPGKLPLLGSMKETKTEKFFWNWFSSQARQRAGVQDSAARLDALRAKANVQAWMPTMVRQFEQSLTSAQQAGVPVLVLARASIDISGTDSNSVRSAGERLTDHGLDAVAAEHVKTRQVAFVSTKQTFSSQPTGAIFADNAHWHDLGHQLMAAALLEPTLGLLNAHRLR
jgi:hypothetical protein